MKTASSSVERLGRLAQAVMCHDRCVLLVRHGQTDWNVEDRITTRTDRELTERGVAQARELAASLAGARFDRALASPLRRAYLTGQIALSRTLAAPQVIADERLIEPDAGPFEGELFSELRSGGPLAEQFADYQRESDPVYPDGCETVEQSAAKARAFLDEISVLEGRTFVATHGAFLRILVCEFLGAPAGTYRRYKIDNCGAVLLKLHPGPPHQLAGLNLLP